MDNKCTILISLILLSAALTQGFSISRGDRCLCTKLAKRLNVLALAKLEIFPSSPGCEKFEYIATLKNSPTPKCVSPHLFEVRVLLSGKNRQLKHIPVITHPGMKTTN
ncbi:PREDICTED: C-X-C motif chemokine 10-like [Nanorana parkeri]|uniref:C-X-C motif chemokine 10-like n=1 Tax=Nanorana parkeri TaxID=125878 RepID=UPI000854C3AD|nr:PREDICTED: C-X-C motif chemokine 10-like [Nanorana parkeri]